MLQDQHCYAALTVGTEVAAPSGGVISLLYLNTQAIPMNSCDNFVADAMECQVRLQHGSITPLLVLPQRLQHVRTSSWSSRQSCESCESMASGVNAPPAFFQNSVQVLAEQRISSLEKTSQRRYF